MAQSVFRLGLIGYPLNHSFSPMIHAAALKGVGLAGEYSLYPVSPFPEGEKIFKVLSTALRSGELDGLNVTIPHKQSVVPFLDRLTLRAENMGAVNTIYRDGSFLVGENTDSSGFIADLTTITSLFPQKAIVLGAGGAARAVVYGLLEQGCEVYLAARRKVQAEEVVVHYQQKLADDVLLHAISLDTGSLIPLLDKVDLVVNTTPVGMFPDVHASPWPENVHFPEHAIIYDTVYNPQKTKLILDAQYAGLTAVSGLGMLVHQAALSFESWTGISAPTGEMRMAVESRLGR